ncbi:MAG TPA: homoserine O-succinyltransferase [Acidothermaceae bacterium]|nr:homoserine O-succinyltransferase [Acidothermaceae bacterium]
MTVCIGPSHRHASGPSTTASETGMPRALRLAFVNNMPDAAFEETEQQFRHLLQGGLNEPNVHLRCYALPSIERGALVRAKLARDYLHIADLYAEPPDALIVTGTEPRSPDLRNEAYWSELVHLFTWAVDNVSSLLLSCLASHAALLAFDGIERVPRESKCSGVFPQSVHTSHPLVRSVAPVQFPHSRMNGVPSEALQARGYTVVVQSSQAEWTVATVERNRCVLVLFQGHPEYSASTLLREYRRDVRRYLNGERPSYPEIPSGYLDAVGDRLLRRFEAKASPQRDPALMTSFPFDAAERHIAADWQRASKSLVSNWLQQVEQRRAAVGVGS